MSGWSDDSFDETAETEHVIYVNAGGVTPYKAIRDGRPGAL